VEHRTDDDRVETVETAAPAVCGRCGTVRPALPLTWTCSVENGERVHFCDACARANIRAIEGRLDSAWW
jgi:hypothetical protein